MKYFQTHTPYYALIKAESKESAIDIYVKTVADDDDDTLKDVMHEVSRDYALSKHSRALSDKDYFVPIEEALKSFCADGDDILLIHSSLI